MRYIEFGQNKALVSEVVLGSMRIPAMSAAEVQELLETCLDEGINMADKYGVTPGAVALAWILRYPAKMQAVIGTTKASRIRESARACDFELTKSEWYELYKAAGRQLP